MAQAKPKRDVSKDRPLTHVRAADSRPVVSAAPVRKPSEGKRTQARQKSSGRGRVQIAQTRKPRRRRVRTASYIMVDNRYEPTLRLSSDAATQYVSVSTDGSRWDIFGADAYWHTARKIDQTTLAVDVAANPSHEPRRGFLTVQSGPKQNMVTIEQQGKPYQPVVEFYSMGLSHNVSYNSLRSLCGTLRFSIAGVAGTPVRVFAFVTDGYGTYLTQGGNKIFGVSDAVTPLTDRATDYTVNIYLANYQLASFARKKRLRVFFAVYCDAVSEFVGSTNFIPFRVKSKRKGVVTRD